MKPAGFPTGDILLCGLLDFFICLSIYTFIRKGFNKLRAGDLFFRLLIPGGIVGGMSAARAVPVGDLFLANGLARLSRSAEESDPSPLAELCAPTSKAWIALCLVSAALESYWMCQMNRA